MKTLVKYVHKLGLKFGIYENFGDFTCMGFPGSRGNLQKDALLFTEWKVDFVKLDGCFSDNDEKTKAYPDFGRYLNQSGQRVVYSCSWPYYFVEKGIAPNYTAIEETCNLWRNFKDVQDSWDSVLEIVNYYGEHQDSLSVFHGPGHWNDADMLEIGNNGLNYEQSKAQMALWCVMGVPLFMSTDLIHLEPKSKEILLNKVAIGVNQDPLGKMGRRISNVEGVQIWRKAILPQDNAYYSYAVVVLNTRNEVASVAVTAEELGLYHPDGYVIQDVFDPQIREPLNQQQTITADVQPTGVAFWKFTVKDSRDDAIGSGCDEETAVRINLPDRTPYSVDVIGLIYLAMILAMLYILSRSRVRLVRRPYKLDTV